MAQCPTSNERLFGGAVVLEVADGCADIMPPAVAWKSLAAGTSKGFDFGPNTVTSDADDGAGFVESIVTNSDFTISFEGEVRKRDRLDQYGIGKFIKYFADELKARRQPGLWVRMDYGPVVFTGYMVVTALSSDGGTNDIVTFTTEFKVGDASTITVEEAPLVYFTTQPPSTKSVNTGSALAFTAVAMGGTPPLSYQWYKDNQLITGQTNAALNIPSAAKGDAGIYKVVATDSAAKPISATSTPMIVTVV